MLAYPCHMFRFFLIVDEPVGAGVDFHSMTPPFTLQSTPGPTSGGAVVGYRCTQTVLDRLRRAFGLRGADWALQAYRPPPGHFSIFHLLVSALMSSAEFGDNHRVHISCLLTEYGDCSLSG